MFGAHNLLHSLRMPWTRLCSALNTERTVTSTTTFGTARRDKIWTAAVPPLRTFPPAFHFDAWAPRRSRLYTPPSPPTQHGESVLVAIRTDLHVHPLNEHNNTGHLFRSYAQVVPACAVSCEFLSVLGNTSLARFDALWYHGPRSCGSAFPERAFAAQIAVIGSIESSINYYCLDDPVFMSRFDVEMTYRLSSHIPLPYLHADHVAAIARPLLPFKEKRDEVIFIASNCLTHTFRDEILRLVSTMGVVLHSRGGCLNNMPSLSLADDKWEVMRVYKICVAIENSQAVDCAQRL